MKYIIFLFTTLFVLQAHAQRELSMQEAVLGQYFHLKPESLDNFNWLNEKGKYAYTKEYTTLIIGTANEQEKDTISIQQLNETIETNFSYFQNLNWKNESEFILFDDSLLVSYNMENEKAIKLVLPENSAHHKLNPQKNKIAYVIENNLYYSSISEFEQHAITSYDDKEIVSGQAISRSEMGITEGIFWSPSGEKIAFYQKDESEVHDYPLVNINDYPATLTSIKYPMNSQPSEQVKVGIYALADSSVNYISPSHGRDYYLTNVTWTPDSEYILLAEIARSQKNIWLRRFTDQGKEGRTLFQESRETWVEPEIPAHFPNPDNNDFVWVSEKDGFNNLYYYSFEDGKLIRQLTENQFVLKEIVATHNGVVYFTATGKSPLNTLLYRVDANGKQKLLTKQKGTHRVAINKDATLIFDQYSAHDLPNRAVIRNQNGKVKEELVKAKNPLETYKFNEAEISSIQNQEGTELYTRMIKPRDFDPKKKYPVLIYVYGGPHAQLITNSWLDAAPLWMYWMADQDYIVFTLDNRGSGNRGVEFEHAIHRQMGVKEFEDQMAGVEYLKSLKYIDTNRIAVHGWSYGGFMTGTMMMKAPDVFKVGVAGGPVTDWKFYEVMYSERYMDNQENNAEGFEKTSLLNQAHHLKGDLMIVNGSVDPIVVPQHIQALLKRFIDLGIQVDYFEYPMHEHNILGKDRIHLMTKVLQYIIEKNGGATLDSRD